jgi:cytosine/adenosine deaminase-related metal-dependent hydrolase
MIESSQSDVAQSGRAAAKALSPERYLIQGARVLTISGPQEEIAADVLVEDGIIRAIGDLSSIEDARRLDASDTILLPGFVDTHRHTWQTQLRTTAADWSLYDYLARMRMEYSSCYQPEDVYLGNYAGALEALNAGVTTLVDHCHILNSPGHSDAALAGLSDAGIRAIFCYGLFANPKHHPFCPEADSSWRRDDARRIRQLMSSDTGRVLFGFAPTEAEAVPFDLTAEEIRFARELGAHKISLHIAMGAYDQGNKIVSRLQQQGLVASDLLIVHGSALSDEELGIIADAGAGISSTPETELQMGMGHPVAVRARARGVASSLGIDIVSNFSGDMFAQMRLFLQAERAQANAQLASHGFAPRRIDLKSRDALRLATLGGAEACGLANHIGSIEVGKRADLQLIRTTSLNMCPSIDAVSSVVLNANASDVDMVMVAGEIVKSEGRLLGADWPGVSRRLRASSQRIVEEAKSMNHEVVNRVADGFFGNLR